MSDMLSTWYTMYEWIYKVTKPLNESKFFAGLIIIVLNLSSKLVDVRLSKSMESYFKNTFSRQLLVFAMAWMPTRDVFVALVVSSIVIFCVDYLFNDESSLCIFPEHFTSYHLSMAETSGNGRVITSQDVKNANDILDKIKMVLADKQSNKESNTSETQPSVQQPLLQSISSKLSNIGNPYIF